MPESTSTPTLIEHEPMYLAQLDELHLRPKNERKHSKRNVADIARSLKEFGQQAPIVIVPTTGEVVKGNGTTLAARELGWKEIVVKLTDLEGQDVDEYAIADNQTGTTSTWDVENLAMNLRAFRIEDPAYDFGKLGFRDFEVAPILEADWTPPEIVDKAVHATTERIALTKEQREVFDLAADRVRESAGDLADGDCLVVICSGFMP